MPRRFAAARILRAACSGALNEREGITLRFLRFPADVKQGVSSASDRLRSTIEGRDRLLRARSEVTGFFEKGWKKDGRDRLFDPRQGKVGRDRLFAKGAEGTGSSTGNKGRLGTGSLTGDRREVYGHRGMVLGLGRQFSGSVAPPMSAHAAFDLVVYGALAHAPWQAWR